MQKILLLVCLCLASIAGGWEMRYGDAALQDGRITVQKKQKIGYVIARQIQGPLRSWSCSMTVSGSGKPVANGGPEGAAPNMRPMLMSSMWGANNRWWYAESMPIQGGSHQLNIKLHPSMWTNVYGKRADLNANTLKHFNRVKKEDPYIVYTAGGNDHFGHGVTTQDLPIYITIQQKIEP